MSSPTTLPPFCKGAVDWVVYHLTGMVKVLNHSKVGG
jgi:hypothetical protein